MRALVIKEHLLGTKYKGVVLFTSGEAGRALSDVLKGTKYKVIIPRTKKWHTPKDIALKWPNYFDATSGHLPLWLMVKIANVFRQMHLSKPCYVVPTGSGECIICLKLAYPQKEFVAVYNLGKPTKFEPNAPLNDIIKDFFNARY